MKQPELGKKLAEFRNEKGLTQEQVSEKSKINIRTIQRIESGEVTPRVYTLQTIMEILERDYSEINGENDKIVFDKPEILKGAWIAGLGLMMCNILYIILGILRDIFNVSNGFNHLIVFVALTGIILIIFFNRGIIYLGNKINNSFFIITGYIGIFLSILLNISNAGQYYISLPHIKIITKAFVIMNAINGIFYGVGLILFRKYMGDLALVAGILMFFTCVLYMIPVGFIEFIGVFMSISTLILQVIIFYRLQEQKTSFSAYC